jgi:hypothetical protein
MDFLTDEEKRLSVKQVRERVSTAFTSDFLPKTHAGGGEGFND